MKITHTIWESINIHFIFHCWDEIRKLTSTFVLNFLLTVDTRSIQSKGSCRSLAGDETVSSHPDDRPHFRTDLLLRLALPPQQPQHRHAPIISYHQRDLPEEKVHSRHVNDESVYLFPGWISSLGAGHSHSSCWKKVFWHRRVGAFRQHLQDHRVLLLVLCSSPFIGRTAKWTFHFALWITD